MIMPVERLVLELKFAERANAEGEALYARLLAEACAVVAEVMAVESSAPEGVAALHRAAGDDVAHDTLSVLADLLTA
ncbi:MAG: hypothetical protein JWQ99_2262 [Blastococcus sp.]|nr:hypothetical protein [Blastococcus sp.]